MKKIFIIIMLFFIFKIAFSQVPPMVDKKVIYSQVEKLDTTVKKATLYANAKMWFANSFKSANDVIQLDDKENGIILGKGNVSKDEVSFLTKTTYRWKFTVKFQVKDGKYKVEFYDIDYTIDVNDSRFPPNTFNLNTVFNDESYYKSDGSLKRAGLIMANKTNEIFNDLLLNVKNEMAKIISPDKDSW
ncbi:MAG: DUF4468 domain-containing protein [Bacteroidales bacterium]